jgi:septal ring factor EnvC (AmiA/AmiB activator)
MHFFRIHIILFICFFSFLENKAQSTKTRAQLEAEKKKNLANIAKVKKVLNATQKEKQNTLGQINVLNAQIDNQERTIALANEDIELITAEMKELVKAQDELLTQLKNLRKEYAETLYRSSKKSNKLTKLGFLFSSSSINELFMRYKYLEQYTESRKQQLQELNQISEMLKQRQRTLMEKKIKQQTLISQINIETKSLEILKERQALVISDLNKKEEELQQQLEKSRTALKNLNNVIANAIAAEKANRKIPASRREAIASRNESENKKREAVAKNSPQKTEVAKIKNFKSAKSKLEWPVSGFISGKFGVKNHPVLKGVKIENNGIDIQTSPNEPVKAVFEGVVLDISQIPGLNNVVAIQHGDYYTVYANLVNVSVSINQTVKANQRIGLAAEKEGSPEINFQIWHNFDKLNPEPWLGSK